MKLDLAYHNEILEALKKHQHELINVLNDRYPAFRNEGGELEKVAALPKFGSFEISSGYWSFHVHGIGVKFVNIGTMEIVDMEDNIAHPEYTSTWRLSVYEKSIGKS